MLKTILVPLDGSTASEHALPVAVSFARRSGAALRLVHVRAAAALLPGKPPPPKEQDYLDMLAWRIRRSTHLSVYTAVLEGPTAETLSDHALSVKAGLIVMTTHGRGAFSRMWLGSVADSLIRHAPTPIVVLRPGERDAEAPPPDRDWKPQRILVALDGSTLAEAALRSAVEIAKLTQAELFLLRIVEPIPVLAPDGLVPQPTILDATLIDQLKDNARIYLETLADKLRKDGLAVSTLVCVDDRVAPTILEQARDDDLIALATHARRGVARLLLGSVADKLVRGATVPVLVTPPEPD